MPASLSFSFSAFFQTFSGKFGYDRSNFHRVISSHSMGPMQFNVPGGVHDFQIIFNEFQHFVNAIIVGLAPRLGNLVKNEIDSHATALHIKHFGLKFTFLSAMIYLKLLHFWQQWVNFLLLLAHLIQVTWPRWPPCPYMVKTFKNLLLQNQKSYDLETWHVASGTQALQSLYKWWPWVDHELFYRKVKLGHLYVWMGQTVTK